MVLDIGENIRKIRTLRGLSQEYVAAKLDISQAAYSDIENNKTKLNLKRLEQLSRLFEVQINNILTFDENNTINESSQKNILLQETIINYFEKERHIYTQQINYLREEIQFLRELLKK